jgi:protein-disulfide isomerase
MRYGAAAASGTVGPVERRFLVVGAVVAAVVVVAVVAGTVLADGGDGGGATTGVELAGADETRALLEGIPQDGTAIGAADAPVTLVEFADLQCPFCRQWATDAFPDLVRDYVRPGKLRIEFRGLTFIGPDSETALRAALSAGEQERLWHVVELLYQNQGEENSGWVTDELLDAVAASAMIDAGPWRDGFDSAAVDDGIQSAAAAATAAGVDSTPSFLVGPTGGTLAPVQVQSLDADALRPAIEQALAG